MWLVPALRFPEFSGEWHKHSLGEIGETIIGLTYKPSDVVADNGIIVLRSSNIKNGVINYSDLVRVNKNVKDRIITKENDILVCSRNGSQRLIGKNAIIKREDINNTFGAFMMVYRSNDNPFILPLLSTRRYISQVGENLGARINQITTSDFNGVEFYFPENHVERAKIAELFRLLDERIATQNKIIEKLETLIKGITDVLLDNPLWEKVFLHSFMQFYPSNSLSWEQLSYEDGKIRNLHYGLIHNFSTKGINANSLPMILSHNEPKQYTLCKVGDVAFADASEDTNEIGKAVEFISVHPSGTICGLHTLHGRDIKNKTVVGFKGFAFNSRYFHDQIKRLAQGSKVFSITAKNLLSCYIYIPNIAKQEMITKLLHAYEEKIVANKTLLDKYEMQRTYLQQRMFI